MVLLISGFWWVFGVGIVGGLALEVLHWYGLRDSANNDVYKKSLFYWIITALMILIGGALAVFYGIESIDAMLAFNVGASAPALIASASKAVNPESPKTDPTKSMPSVLNFLAWR